MVTIVEADVIIYYGNQDDYSYVPGQELKPIEGMGKYVAHGGARNKKQQQLYVFVRRKAGAAADTPSQVEFETFVEIGPEDDRQSLYKGYDRQIHGTNHNIDSECNKKKIWKDADSADGFNRFFKINCYGR